MLEVSRDAVTAVEEQLASCAAKQSKYCSICTVTLDPGKRQTDILLLVDTTIEGASPYHARQE
jgi:hypothetical protein